VNPLFWLAGSGGNLSDVQLPKIVNCHNFTSLLNQTYRTGYVAMAPENNITTKLGQWLRGLNYTTVFYESA